MNNIIRFYYGFSEQTILFSPKSEYKPSDTLLYYLRKSLGVKATREGCGVGDCGACTVILAELRDGKIFYYPVNSCLLMLPMLQGKWLITSNHLRNGTELHPIQQSLLKHYGVQCGFCTSGMLMSMLGLFKNTIHPNRTIVEERLTGNLCRCTGYHSIYDAVVEVCDGSLDHFTAHEKYVKKWMEENPVQDFLYTNEGDSYYRPLKLQDALSWYIKERPYPICGSSDTIVANKKLGREVPHYLDLNAVEELKKIYNTEQGLMIGASVTIEEVRNKAKEQFPALYSLLGKFASFQIRQIASITGNLASSSPIGDTIPMLMAHHAIIRIARVDNGKIELREVPVNEFITGYRQNVLKDDELIHSIFIPHLKEKREVYCYKVSNRRSVDISTLSLSVRISRDKNICKEIELYYGGMAESVKRAFNAEKVLLGRQICPESIEVAQKALQEDFSPISDPRATAAKRTQLAGNLLMFLCPEIAKEVNN